MILFGLGKNILFKYILGRCVIFFKSSRMQKEQKIKKMRLVKEWLNQGYRDRYDIIDHGHEKTNFYVFFSQIYIQQDKGICYHCFMEVSYKLWFIGGVLSWCRYHFLTSDTTKL